MTNRKKMTFCNITENQHNLFSTKKIRHFIRYAKSFPCVKINEESEKKIIRPDISARFQATASKLAFFLVLSNPKNRMWDINMFLNALLLKFIMSICNR